MVLIEISEISGLWRLVVLGHRLAEILCGPPFSRKLLGTICRCIGGAMSSHTEVPLEGEVGPRSAFRASRWPL